MSEHVSEACSEGSGVWIPLTEYSVKSGISTSTIRRKIKSNTIPYRLENGKYLILFEGSGNMKETVSGTTMEEPYMHSTTSETASVAAQENVTRTKFTKPRLSEAEDAIAFPIMEKAVQMVGDAFEHTLREKDARIKLLEKENSQLRERLDELRTLVQVLEEKYDIHY